jgi:hypothetical protein
MSNRERFDPLALVSKIANQEKELLGTTFIAPYVGGGKVRLRLNGIIYEMQARDCPEGWSILEVVSAGKASFVQRAPLSMVRNYLHLFPRLRIVMLERFEDRWWALAASNSGQEIQLDGPVPVQLMEKAAAFDTVYCRFDGTSFWFESVDRRRDPSVARNLRKALAEGQKPDDVHCKSMVPQERLAYKMLWMEKHKKAPEEQDDATRIARALEHAGARLDTFWYMRGERGATVRFHVDGQVHVATVQPKDLTVVSAGICLSGQDANFDLASLVGVLREANSGGYFYD